MIRLDRKRFGNDAYETGFAGPIPAHTHMWLRNPPSTDQPRSGQDDRHDPEHDDRPASSHAHGNSKSRDDIAVETHQ
jgi:hypothetical protein